MKGKYRVRRLGPKRFRNVNPSGDYVENDAGNVSQFANYAQAIGKVRAFESGKEREPHPLLEDFDDTEQI